MFSALELWSMPYNMWHNLLKEIVFLTTWNPTKCFLILERTDVSECGLAKSNWPTKCHTLCSIGLECDSRYMLCSIGLKWKIPWVATCGLKHWDSHLIRSVLIVNMRFVKHLVMWFKMFALWRRALYLKAKEILANTPLNKYLFRLFTDVSWWGRAKSNWPSKWWG